MKQSNPIQSNLIFMITKKCINCSACANFAPLNFKRTTTNAAHVVYQQPSTPQEITDSRAAMAACPVAAIRVETNAHRSHNHHFGLDHFTDLEQELTTSMALSPKINKQNLPFPRILTKNVWYLGHHNEKSFGAMPYLLHTTDNDQWIMVDTPRFCTSAVQAVTSLTGPTGPTYLFLTHVDDTADHGKWVVQFPLLKRIFHSGDLGTNNWLGDDTLEQVEILLPITKSSFNTLSSDEQQQQQQQRQAFYINGTILTKEAETAVASSHELIVYHTPGHSPGSISLYHRPSGVLFSGDTLGYSNRLNTLTGFPQYGNNRLQQAETLQWLKDLDWTIVAPGHGHVKNYGNHQHSLSSSRNQELEDAIQELSTTTTTR